jgi:L-ascorbate metabolism protein UlaG (beta-lactamase superfamily)
VKDHRPPLHLLRRQKADDRNGGYELVDLGKSDTNALTHLTPEEAVQAFIDLKARTLLGIHWGTFDLAEEPLDEPPQRMLAEIRRRNIDLSRAWILKIGETRRW